MPHADPDVRRAYLRAWREKNREHLRAWEKAYAPRRPKNPEARQAAQVRYRAKYPGRTTAYRRAHAAAVLARERAWLAANRERRRAYQHRYWLAHRDQYRADTRAYLARRRGAAGMVTMEQLVARIGYYGARCYLCAAPYAEIDHVIPLALGGSNWPANLRPICRSCNRGKGARRVHRTA